MSNWKGGLTMARVIIDVDGQVLPCCFIANSLYRRTHDSDIGFDPNNEIMQAYVKNLKDFNIFNHSLEVILSNEWFTKILPESWEDMDTAMPVCRNFCSIDGGKGIKCSWLN